MINGPKIEIATFAAGCFYGVQHAFDQVEGVVETTAGYMGGGEPKPTYQEVCAGGTGHVEAVQVKYDPTKVMYKDLLQIFWEQVPKITLGALDWPTKQYTPVIFHDDEQWSFALHSLQTRRLSQPHATSLTTIKPAVKFWPELDQTHQHHDRKKTLRTDPH